MTKERAQYILDNMIMGDLRYSFKRKCDVGKRRLYADGITEEEDRYVKKVWETLPSWTSYYNALLRISLGEV